MEKKPPQRTKKVRCPKCGAEIDYLLVFVEETGVVYVDSGGIHYDWGFDAYGGSAYAFQFGCPECFEILFTDPGDAEKFLMGE
jgi:hypothetical protein